MDKGKDLIVVKESFFSKIVKKIKNIFRKEKIEEYEAKCDLSVDLKNEKKQQFKDSIKAQDNSEILVLKRKLENGEINAIDLTDEQIDELQNIFDREIIEKKNRLKKVS